MSQYTDRLLKIIIIGNSSVGKSCILLRYAQNNFTTAFYSTIGVDFKMKNINLDGKKIRLQIWDTAGQERFRNIISSYYKSAHGVMMVFDITNKESFESLRFWQQETEKYGSEDMVKMVLGNKVDKQTKREVDTQLAKQYADSNNFEFMEVSALSNKNIAQAFQNMARLIIKKLQESPIKSSVTLPKQLESSTKKNETPETENKAQTAKCKC